MTLVHLLGGTGNQLFCLFAGIAYQNLSDERVVFDQTYLNEVATRGSRALADFDLYFNGNIFKVEISPQKESRSIIFLNRVIYKIQKIFGKKIVFSKQHRSKVFGFDEDFNLNTRYNRIFGYFQTFFYVSQAENFLGNLEIRIKKPSEWFVNLSQNVIKENNSVAIHIRRGDYFQHSQSIGMLSLEYFYSNLTKLMEKQSILYVYIFSDSQIDLREFELLFPNVKFFSIEAPAESSPIESIVLMSLTSFRIISNSSFSWWAAYLSKCGQSNYAPDPWFKSRELPGMLFPGDWNLLDPLWVD